MKKKGFSLVELLAVIIILGLVTVIAVTSINGVSKIIKDKMYKEKIEMIEEAAELWGQDNKNVILESVRKYNDTDYPCVTIHVYDLVPNYMENDTNKACKNSTSDSNPGCVADPQNDENFLDLKEVIVYSRTRRIKAVIKDDTQVCK